jgi:hypothetical protein
MEELRPLGLRGLEIGNQFVSGGIHIYAYQDHNIKKSGWRESQDNRIA